MIIVPIIALYHKIDKTVLLSVRLQGKDFAGFYEFPGGKTQEHELPTEALCREIYEELNISILQNDLKPITFIESRHKNKEYLLLMYYCDVYSGTPIGNEGQEIHFISLQNLLDYKMPPANRAIIPILQEYIKKL
jgi:8-oxo-dGTP diphosphatase